MKTNKPPKVQNFIISASTFLIMLILITYVPANSQVQDDIFSKICSYLNLLTSNNNLQTTTASPDNSCGDNNQIMGRDPSMDPPPPPPPPGYPYPPKPK